MICFLNLISCSFTQGFFFSSFWYQILQGFTNGTLGKNKSSLLHIHVQIFFFLNWLIADYKIFPTCNSLLICKCEGKQNLKMTNKNIKYLLQLQLKPCYSIGLVATRSKKVKNCKIIRFREKSTCKQCLNKTILSISLLDLVAIEWNFNWKVNSLHTTQQKWIIPCLLGHYAFALPSRYLEEGDKLLLFHFRFPSFDAALHQHIIQSRTECLIWLVSLGFVAFDSHYLMW